MSGGSRDDVGRFTVSCTSIQFLCLIFLVSCPIFVDKCSVAALKRKSPPPFPLRLSPFLREKIFIREYPYRGLRLSIEFFSLYTCYYSLSDLVLQAHRTGLFYSDIPPMPRSCVCCCLCSVCSHSGRISRTLSSSGRRLSGKCSSK